MHAYFLISIAKKILVKKYVFDMEKTCEKLKFLSTNRNFVVENIFTVNHFSYFINVKFLLA